MFYCPSLKNMFTLSEIGLGVPYEGLDAIMFEIQQLLFVHDKSCGETKLEQSYHESGTFVRYLGIILLRVCVGVKNMK